MASDIELSDGPSPHVMQEEGVIEVFVNDLENEESLSKESKIGSYQTLK